MCRGALSAVLEAPLEAPSARPWRGGGPRAWLERLRGVRAEKSELPKSSMARPVLLEAGVIVVAAAGEEGRLLIRLKLCKARSNISKCDGWAPSDA